MQNPITLNPFIYGDPVSPENFIGRKKYVRRIVGRIQNGQSTAIIGDPHIGKTSLLTYLTSPEMRQELYGEQAQDWYLSSLDAQMFSSQFTPTDFWKQALMPLKDVMFPHPADVTDTRNTDRGIPGEYHLSAKVYQKVLDWFLSLPNLHDGSAQQALLNSAVLDSQLRQYIHTGTSAAQFFHTLVPILTRYGTMNDGRNALEAVLEATKNYVGQEGQTYCQQLIQEISQVFREQAQALPQHDDSSIAKYYAICADNDFGNFTLERLFTKLKNANQHFLLFLDEFDALLHHPVLNSVEFYGGLRSLASRCPAFTLVIASRTPISQLNKLTQEFNPTGSPFFNIFSEITLGPLAEKDANALFTNAEGRFDAREKAFLTALAGRHPFLLQAASAMLWETFEEEDLLDSEQIRTHVATRLYRESKHFFTDTWNVWTPEMRKAFTAAAISHQSALLPDSKSRLSALLKNFPHWGPELSDLEERGLIVKAKAALSETGYLVSAGILLAWLADELVKASRSDQPFERWLQEQHIEGAFLSNKEEKAFKDAVTATAKALGNGATAIIEALGKGIGSGIAGKIM